MSQRSNARIEKKLQKIKEELQRTMENYPDGRITDLIGAQHVYDLMNKAAGLARKAGYTDQEIENLLIESRKPPDPVPPPINVSNPCAPGQDSIFEERR